MTDHGMEQNGSSDAASESAATHVGVAKLVPVQGFVSGYLNGKGSEQGKNDAHSFQTLQNVKQDSGYYHYQPGAISSSANTSCGENNPTFSQKRLKSQLDNSRVTTSVFYIEQGQRRDARLSASEPLTEPKLSIGVTQYQDRLHAIWLRKQGLSHHAVATKLGKEESWVARWCDEDPHSLQRPEKVPPYVAEYEIRMLKSGVKPFRPAELQRRYVQDTAGLYEECAQRMPWVQAVFRKRNYTTGEVTVTNIASNRQNCSYRSLRTGIPRLDAALERVRHDYAVEDPNAYLLNNWYPDGQCSIAPHNHDFWSAIISFGAPRVFVLDGQPVLLGDGDLLVFGTQRHSVPKMPAVAEGRISVAIFWYPEVKQKEMAYNEAGESINLVSDSDDEQLALALELSLMDQ